jgi:Zn-dependent protease with chaperone function
MVLFDIYGEQFKDSFIIGITDLTAHMFIMHPFSGSSLMNLFSALPPTQKRIERLLGRSN